MRTKEDKLADALKPQRTDVSLIKLLQARSCSTEKNSIGQGQSLMQYFGANCDGGSCDFDVSFGNPGATNVAYCFAYQDRAGKCLNDREPPIFKKVGGRLSPDANWADSASKVAAVERANDPMPEFALFILASGMEVVMRKLISQESDRDLK